MGQNCCSNRELEQQVKIENKVLAKRAMYQLEQETEEDDSFIYTPTMTGNPFVPTMKRKQTPLMSQRSEHLEEMRIELGLSSPKKRAYTTHVRGHHTRNGSTASTSASSTPKTVKFPEDSF